MNQTDNTAVKQERDARSYGYFLRGGDLPPTLSPGRYWLAARFGFEITGIIAADGKTPVHSRHALPVMTLVATDIEALRDMVYKKIEEALGCRYLSLNELVHVFPDIPDLLARLDPGGTVPAGECVKCGALVYREGDSCTDKL